jgi:hypothetical protein
VEYEWARQASDPVGDAIRDAMNQCAEVCAGTRDDKRKVCQSQRSECEKDANDDWWSCRGWNPWNWRVCRLDYDRTRRGCAKTQRICEQIPDAHYMTCLHDCWPVPYEGADGGQTDVANDG